MSSWDWQVFCKDTIDGEIVPRCFGGAGDVTYLDWLLSAWGWTLSVSRPSRPRPFRTTSNTAS